MGKAVRKKTYHGYEARLETFSGARVQGAKPRSRKVTWPHAQPSATQLAKAGFYFTPSPLGFGADLVTCYMCGCGIDGWEPEDIPLQVHAENCPTCPLASLQSKPWETDSMYNPKSDANLSTRLQTYYQPFTNEELEEAILNADNKDPLDEGKLSIQAPSLLGTSVWPHDNKTDWLANSENMAKAGFYYFPNFAGEDFALCPYCGLGLDGWEPSDEPVHEHQKRSPDCFFFTAISVSPLTRQKKLITDLEYQDSIDDGNISSVSTASSTSSKRKKKATKKEKPRKKLSKAVKSSTSLQSELDGSDASILPKSTKYRKREPSAKNSSISKQTQKEDCTNGDSVRELDQTFKIGAKQSVVTKNKISDRISAFENFASEAAKHSPQAKPACFGVKMESPRPLSPEVGRTNSIKTFFSTTASTTDRIIPKHQFSETKIKEEEKSSRVQKSPAFKKSISHEEIKEAGTLLESSKQDEAKPTNAESSENIIEQEPSFHSKHDGPTESQALEGHQAKLLDESQAPTKSTSTPEPSDLKSESNSFENEQQETIKEPVKDIALQSPPSNVFSALPASLTSQYDQASSVQHEPAKSPLEIYQDAEDVADPESPLLPPKVPAGMSENWACFSCSSSDESRAASPAPPSRIPGGYKNRLNLDQSPDASPMVASPVPSRPQLTDTQTPSQSDLSMRPKMPLGDTTLAVRNATPPPPVSYGDDETRDSAMKSKESVTTKEPTQSTFSPKYTESAAVHTPTQHHDLEGTQNTNWTNSDLDMVFDFITPNDADSNEKELMEAHLDKTMQEWIRHLADESERRLKDKCDALISMLEKESHRAIAALEALPVKA